MGLNKKRRFEVFARDGFTCRYCGQSPPDVKLQVDHVIPRAKGGDDHEANLVTSCAACNSGKGARSPEDAMPTESDRTRMMQEGLEQIDAADVLHAALTAREEMRQSWLDYVCALMDFEWIDSGLLTRITRWDEEFGTEKMIAFLDSACMAGIRTSTNLGRYLGGCVRKTREELEGVEASS